jgi:hypothetical protein
MGRPLTGSVERKDGAWVASVPVRKGDRRRLTCSFPTQRSAQRWVKAQVERLDAGLDAEPAAKQGRLRRQTTTASITAAVAAVGATGEPGEVAAVTPPQLDFAACARRWHHEKYVLLHGADAERTRDVLADLENHIIPVLAGPITGDVLETRDTLIAWVRVLAGYPGETGGPEPGPDARTYARTTVSGWLWIVGEVYRYAQVLGAPVAMVSDKRGMVPAVTKDIGAMTPRGRRKRKAKLVSLPVTARIAVQLHVIHQTALWIMRIAGLRIGEVYGVCVHAFIEDAGWGHLLVEAQGGKNYKVRDTNEEVTTTTRKEVTKTQSGYRLIALPPALTALIRLIIAAYHTDPETGVVNGDARLIPTIRSAGGGRAGFEAALRAAVGGLNDGTDPDDFVIPHDLRKAYATDLAWSEVEPLVKRRAMGHRAGTDVFDLVYTLDDRLKEAMRPAALVIQAEIEATIGSLVVTTAKRPLYGKDWDPDRVAYADDVLSEADWQIQDFGDDWIGTAEAAAILGGAESATRRLFRDQIPAVKHDGAWLARRDDVEAYRDRFAGWHRLDDIGAQSGHDYHTVYRTLTRLGIEAHKDEYSRQLLLTTQQAAAVTDELARVDALRERAVPVSAAAKMLRARESSVRLWAKPGGCLTADAETDAAGRTYITRASIRAEMDRRGTAPKETVSAEELRVYAGLDQAGIRALVRAGMLVRVRTGAYTADSVRNWMVGYRPDLLETGLLRAA